MNITNILKNTEKEEVVIANALRNQNFNRLKQLGLLVNEDGSLVSTEALDVWLNPTTIIQTLAHVAKVISFLRKGSIEKNFRFIYDLLNEMEQSQKHSCKKQCSYCCHQRINILKPEIKRIKRFLGSDFSRYRKICLQRSKWIESDWNKGFDCIFLKDNLCEIYDIRPITCRHHLVVTDPVLCMVNKNQVKNISIYEVSVVMSAYILFYDIVGLEEGFV